jgi:hypothetical protein
VRVVIDRIEGDFAVLEVGDQRVDWPAAHLPPGATEGSVLELSITVQTDPEREAEDRLKRLRAKGPSGSSIDL